MGIHRKMGLLAFGEAAKGGLYAFPVNSIKCGSLPIRCKEGVMLFRFLDQLLAKSVTSLPLCRRAAEVPGIQSGSHPTSLVCR